MEIKFICPIWGMVPDYIESINGSIPAVLTKIKAAGYDGVEMAIPLNQQQKTELVAVLKDLDLELVALQWSASGKNAKEYITAFENQICNAASVKPLFINSHTGTDYYSFEENNEILHYAAELAAQLNIKIVHEIHRGKFSFSATNIQQYLKTHPKLRLTADFSHWCVVSESFLQNQTISLANAISCTDHIHARVGHPQGAQVADPRAPEWQEALNHHLTWWDEVIALHRKSETTLFTITPEFGPGNYMPLLPYTQQPVANQWEINNWMKDFLKKRYAV